MAGRLIIRLLVCAPFLLALSPCSAGYNFFWETKHTTDHRFGNVRTTREIVTLDGSAKLNELETCGK
jgi:hypothetical protein